jgi:catechol-2,3-dioxygenase
LAHFGFEVLDRPVLDGIAKRLADAGCSVAPLAPVYQDEVITDVGGIATTDPDGNTVHFHGPVSRHGETGADTAQRPIKYQHVTLATDGIAEMVEFYVAVVGFRISDVLSDGQFVWLRSNRDHHTLAIVRTGQTGLDHYSYDLAEWADFKSWCDRLTEQEVDVTWGPGRHGPGNNLFIFFDDPAGNHIELSAEMEKFHDDRVEYRPRLWEPAPRSVNLWGGQLASWRRTSEGS